MALPDTRSVTVHRRKGKNSKGETRVSVFASNYTERGQNRFKQDEKGYSIQLGFQAVKNGMDGILCAVVQKIHKNCFLEKMSGDIKKNSAKILYLFQPHMQVQVAGNYFIAVCGMLHGLWAVFYCLLWHLRGLGQRRHFRPWSSRPSGFASKFIIFFMEQIRQGQQ